MRRFPRRHGVVRYDVAPQLALRDWRLAEFARKKLDGPARLSRSAARAGEKSRVQGHRRQANIVVSGRASPPFLASWGMRGTSKYTRDRLLFPTTSRQQTLVLEVLRLVEAS
ncbi:hypothetical protein BDV93DRAFT_15151 [Ceratobasidium sp. AG-I]|nr:hypothetical protein BDV93DRAFT_15151 [Ceratobasidium sp. AG-I]